MVNICIWWFLTQMVFPSSLELVEAVNKVTPVLFVNSCAFYEYSSTRERDRVRVLKQKYH
jgi:hypothetical protein